MKQFFEVPNIPMVDNSEWNSALVQIQQPFIVLGRDNAVESSILSLQGHWTIILHWVVRKKWDKKHKIPGDRTRNKIYEPLGNLYFRILQLCLEVHSFNRCDYISAAQWFSCIINHQKSNACKTTVAIASGLRKPPTKTEVINELHKEVSALNAFKYPYDSGTFHNPYDEAKEPHIHKLIAAAVQYADIAPNFRDDYWIPFVEASNKWLTEFSRPSWNVRYAKNGVLYHTSGKGRNQGIFMPSLDEKTLCRSRPKGLFHELLMQYL